MAKADYTVRWCKVAREYVARSTSNPEVTGHSRDPGHAFMALIVKLRELEGLARTELGDGQPKPKGSFACVKGQVSRYPSRRSGKALPTSR